MGEYFVGDYQGEAFVTFSPLHFAALLTLVILNVLMVLYMRKTKNEKVKKIFRYSLAALLILQEISLNVWRIAIGQWNVGESLPVHLCGAAIILSAIILVNNSYSLYELTFFWGLAGATQALLTPDIGIYGFPHYRFFQFFISHGAIVTASIYMTFVQGYRPVPRSLWKAFIVTNVYTVFVAGFNLLVDGNYLFICHKPETPSLLDYLGPWPWYILSLELVGIAMFLLFYSPYAIKDWLANKRQKVH